MSRRLSLGKKVEKAGNTRTKCYVEIHVGSVLDSSSNHST